VVINIGLSHVFKKRAIFIVNYEVCSITIICINQSLIQEFGGMTVNPGQESPPWPPARSLRLGECDAVMHINIAYVSLQI
jgi:hypothetical protein